MKLGYSKNGDYFIPEIAISEQATNPLGKYGRLRRTYLQEHRQVVFNHLVLTEKLFPQVASNPISRFQQKRAIKKQYIATRYGKGAKTAQTTAKSAVKKGANSVGNAVTAMAKNPKVLLVIAALFLLIAVIAGAVSSCSVMFQGAMMNVVSTSYTSENEELIAANDDYTALETALQAQIDNIERDYPDYDEYRYDLAPINHDPHQLASYLTALLQYFKASEVQGELQRVFEQQYNDRCMDYSKG